MEMSGSETAKMDLEKPIPKTVQTNLVMTIPETSPMPGMITKQTLESKMYGKMTDELLVGASTFTGDKRAKLLDLSVKSTPVSREELPSTSQSSAVDGFISLHKETYIKRQKPEAKPQPEKDSERGSGYASSCFNPSTERGYRALGQVAVGDVDYAASNAEQDTFCFNRFGGSETARTDTAGSSNVEVKDSRSSCSVEVIPNFLAEPISDCSYEAKPRPSIEYIPNILSEDSSSCLNEVTSNCSVEVIPNLNEVTPSCEDSSSCSDEVTSRWSFEATPGSLLKELSVKEKSTKSRFQPYPPKAERNILRRSEDKTVQDRETAKERVERLIREKEVKEELRKKIKKRMNIEDQDNRVSAPNIPNFDLLLP